MTTPKILAFAGSKRAGSFNRKLIHLAAESARAQGAEVTEVEIGDFPMPIYDGDMEAKEGVPENVKKLQQIMLAHHGLIISSPEYNSSITPLLKNTIDWTSRSDGKNPELACYSGKFAAIISASPGALGGLRGLFQLRWILSNIGVTVIPQQVSVTGAKDAFGPDGKLVDPKRAQALEKVTSNLVSLLKKVTV